MNNKELGIYVHIPFCKHKCYYCDFISFSNRDKEINNYIEAIQKEINYYTINKELLQKYNVTTIYIGGGTPSYIDSRYIKEILNHLKDVLKNNETSFSDIEITIEINPGTITKQKLKDYKQSGINRISLGLQTSNDRLLKEIGRIHNYNEFLKAYSEIENAGFNNINVDLMIGLPNQNIQDVKESLEKVINLGVNHVSVYSLILEEGTKITNMVEKRCLSLPDEELERQMYWYVKDKLELSGYEHYEISNFARNEKYSKHNMNCWNQKEYIGLGIAAHSYLDGVRYANVSNIDEYITGDFENRIIEETQNAQDKAKEYMLLGLRKIKGVSISEFKSKYIENPIFKYRKELELLVNQKLIEINGDYIKLTNKGLDLANLVWEEFV